MKYECSGLLVLNKKAHSRGYARMPVSQFGVALFIKLIIMNVILMIAIVMI